ncbi:MAG: hypothetical protein B1H04_03780 [Planctomycetales bacterium 4484_123]|nr:MAG: hypothetical protein B1H04_03780 [Planctomycetales bacterium 4484_123]
MLLAVGCGNTATELKAVPTQAYVDARWVLLQAAEDPDPRVRTNALEALAVTEGKAVGAIFVQSLKDDRVPVVAAAAMAIGECRYAPALPELVRLARDPKTPPKLLCALIYALHRLGNDEFTNALGGLLHHRDKFVRAEAARIMGKMGVPSAVGPLKSVQRDDYEVVVRLNVAEALAVLGDERSIGLLEAFTKSQFLEDRLIAVAALGKLRHARSVYVLKRLLKQSAQDPIVRVAAAGCLAELGEDDGRECLLKAVKDPRAVLRKARGSKANIRTAEITTLQTLAVLGLEKLGEVQAVDIVYPLLRSKRGPVRVAAARTILRLLARYRPAGAPPRRARRGSPPATQPTSGPARRPRLHTSGAKD